jgi:zinc and cadmium transporter
MDWLYLILAGLGGGVLSLALGLLLVKSKKEKVITAFATAFAAGTLLSAAFFDLIPESLEEFGEDNTFWAMFFVLTGIIVFFLLEGLLHSFHSHAHGKSCENCESMDCEKCGKGHLPIMITIGDTLHNFMDGVAIAAGFLISPMSGLLITLAIIAHEIPQEIGDLAIMRSAGLSKKKVVWMNVLSSLSSVVGAVIFYAIGDSFEITFAPLFAIVAGLFIYIATTDIIPTIHQEKSKKFAMLKMGVLLLGVAVLATLIWFLKV